MTRYNRPAASAEYWRIEVRDGELHLFDRTVHQADFSRSGIEAAMVALQLAYGPPVKILNTFAKPSARCRREPSVVVWTSEGATCGTASTMTYTVIVEKLAAARRAR